MNIKYQLRKLREAIRVLLINESGKKIENEEISRFITLDDRVDEFIDWYGKNMIKGCYKDRYNAHDYKIIEYSDSIEMRNFIEKIAVWYELRYPDYEINRMMPGSGQELIDIDEVMFQKNPYLNDILGKDIDLKDLDWTKFYNTKAFLNSLSWGEKWVFSKPKYKSVVYWNQGHSSGHLHLSRNGVVESADYMDFLIPGLSYQDFEGKKITEVVDMLKQRKVKLPPNNNFEEAIRDYNNLVYQKEEILNCVMYRIIGRGANRFGPQRAFLFAKEFGRNVDILKSFGINTSEDQSVSPNTEEIKDYFKKTSEIIALENKVDEFIDWYTKNMVKGNYSDTGEYLIPIEMRNFIEKMAIWYELRYPDYELNRKISDSSREEIDINEVMFTDNQYVKDNLEEVSDIKYLDWDKFYNSNAFINSLPSNERCFLLKTKYKSIVYWNRGHGRRHFHLSENGIIEMSDNMGDKIPGMSDKDLEGKHIKEIVEILKQKKVKIPLNNEFKKAIEDYNISVYQTEEMLNCVMYRIIERGGNRFGPRRAFLFAQEFGRSIDIPMAYGVDRTDPGLRLFMNEYIKAGGSKNLICNMGYGFRSSKHEKLPRISIDELIMTQSNDAATFYTPEEDELHQRLVNSITNLINPDDLLAEQKKIEKEEAIQLRLKRKLEKSKKTIK